MFQTLYSGALQPQIFLAHRDIWLMLEGGNPGLFFALLYSWTFSDRGCKLGKGVSLVEGAKNEDMLGILYSVHFLYTPILCIKKLSK